MSETKFTPGPWRVEITEDGSNGFAHKWPIILSETQQIVGTEGLFSDIETDRANAALIAAAPDLYKALKMASESAGFQYMTYETRDAITAALAKARGESC